MNVAHPNRHQNQRISEDFKHLEAQLNIMEFSADCIILRISGLNTNDILE
jgi:hypothetical protein